MMLQQKWRPLKIEILSSQLLCLDFGPINENFKQFWDSHPSQDDWVNEPASEFNLDWIENDWSMNPSMSFAHGLRWGGWLEKQLAGSSWNEVPPYFPVADLVGLKVLVPWGESQSGTNREENRSTKQLLVQITEICRYQNWKHQRGLELSVQSSREIGKTIAFWRTVCTWSKVITG